MMKAKVYKIIFFVTILMIFVSCAASKLSGNEIVTDSVCGMKVNKFESYVWKYSGTKYYFESFDCREIFKLKPQYYIDKKCVKDSDIIDLVCGKKVDLTESYDLKYAGKVYHFESNECKQAFDINPEKFLANKCVRKDSIK
jgi:YHS domain-containing protein